MTQRKLTPAEHQRLIAAYAAVRPSYETYAAVLRRVLEHACAASYPESLVQARAKTMSSFAEKCVRKAGKYRDFLVDMTDLCGARVIVQTLEQVEAVKQFIEANFEVIERDEKGVSLGEERFGYRDLHFIVRLDTARAERLEITAEELEVIGSSKAEVQVRTWLQHAWADTLHDRIYKAPLKLSPDVRRAGNLLAALMEEGDRNYDTLAHELDGMIANYASFAARADVEAEIQAQRLILDHEPDPNRRPGLALRLGRLLAAYGDYAGVLEILAPHEDVLDASRCELLQDLGHALCRIHADAPNSPGHERGRKLLEEAMAACGAGQGSFVLHLRRRKGLLARSTSRLALALEAVTGETMRARALHAQAHAHEPDNPYHLAAMVGFEVYCDRTRELSGALRTRVREAVATCRAHAEHAIELPHAHFAAGRLSVVLQEPLEALGYYALGVRHVLAGTHCVPDDTLRNEREWVSRLHTWTEPPAIDRWIVELLDMAERLRVSGDDGASARPTPGTIIVSGGAATLSPEMLARCRPLLEAALAPFDGRVVSGGTAVGIPGCVGEVAEKLGRRGAKRFTAVGYIPEHLPHDAPRDDRYDELVVCAGSGFSAEQILRSWKDTLAAGVAPADVLCLGFGGGRLSAVDYQVALALGAEVVVAQGSGRAADALAADPLWLGAANLHPVPMDAATFHSLVAQPAHEFDETTLEAVAIEIHGRYVADNAHQLPPTLRPWRELAGAFRRANFEQARHAVRILKAAGFVVASAKDPTRPAILTAADFTAEEIEHMAELEHGRWNVERVRAGWRFGEPRDDVRNLHDCIVGWSDLPDAIKAYDRNAVCTLPAILAIAGLEVRRG